MPLSYYNIQKESNLLDKINLVMGGGKYKIKANIVKLLPSQRLENLITRFRKMHIASIENNKVMELVVILNKAMVVMTKLRNPTSNFMKSRLESDDMSLDRLQSIFDMTGDSTSEGGLDRKLPVVIQEIVQEIGELAACKNMIGDMAEQLMEASVVAFAQTWHKQRGENEDRLNLMFFLLLSLFLIVLHYGGLNSPKYVPQNLSQTFGTKPGLSPGQIPRLETA